MNQVSEQGLKRALGAISRMAPSKALLGFAIVRGNQVTHTGRSRRGLSGEPTCLVLGAAGTSLADISDGDDEGVRRALVFAPPAQQHDVIEARSLRSARGLCDVSGRRFTSAKLELPCIVDLGDASAVFARPGRQHRLSVALAHTASDLSAAHHTPRVRLEAIELLSGHPELRDTPPRLLVGAFASRDDLTFPGQSDLSIDFCEWQTAYTTCVEDQALIDGFLVGRSQRCDWPSFLGDRFPSLSRVHAVLFASAAGHIFICDANSSHGISIPGVRAKTVIEIRERTCLQLTGRLRVNLAAEAI